MSKISKQVGKKGDGKKSEGKLRTIDQKAVKTKVQKKKLEKLTPEELKKRQRQKALREAAIQLREQGLEYTKRNAKILKQRKIKDKQLRKQSIVQQQQQQQEQQYHQPKPATFQVVVVPIFWNRRDRRDERDSVFTLAYKIKHQLQESNIEVWVDITKDKTPGEKMKYWEERGVKARIEVGPKEAQSNQCVLAQVTGVGMVANKQTMVVSSLLVQEIQKLLNIKGEGGNSLPLNNTSEQIQQKKNIKQKGRKLEEQDLPTLGIKDLVYMQTGTQEQIHKNKNAKIKRQKGAINPNEDQQAIEPHYEAEVQQNADPSQASELIQEELVQHDNDNLSEQDALYDNPQAPLNTINAQKINYHVSGDYLEDELDIQEDPIRDNVTKYQNNKKQKRKTADKQSSDVATTVPGQKKFKHSKKVVSF